MADTNKIFKRLQDYAISPPRGLYAKLWKQIRQLQAGNKPLPGTDILPGSPVDKPEVESEEQNIFSSLQNYIHPDIPTPDFDMQKIKEAIVKPDEKSTHSKNNAAVRWLYRTVAAAAVIAGILFMANRYNTNNEDQPPVALKTKIPDTINKQQYPAPPVKKIQDADIAVMNPSETQTGAVERKLSRQKKKNQPLFSSTKYGVENAGSTSIVIRNNDFLYTLTNFNISEANYFLAGIQKDKKIAGNNFSYVNISDKMAGFLKQLYAVNRRNKYTWKARRMRAKLNRWKKEDEENFNIQAGKDPLDILDLSEFLFKK